MKFLRLTMLVAVIVVAAHAQSGLLLGVHVDSTSSGLPAYNTFWIIVEKGKPKIAAVLPDIILPRKDGFWRVGVYETSYTSHHGPDSFIDLPPHGDLYFQDTAARLYVVPANQIPKVEVPAGVRRPVAVPASSEATGDGESHSEDNDGQQLKTDNDEACNSEDILITYVDPSRIGLMERGAQTEVCAPARYAQFGSNQLFYIDDYLAKSPDEGTPPIEVTSMLTQTQQRAILDQVVDENDTDEQKALAMGSVTLAPVRGKGRWELAGWQGGSIASRGGHDLEHTIVAPPALVPRRSAPPALVAQLRGISGLQDYFISPNGDLVVAIIQQRLVAYSVLSGSLGRAVEIHHFAGQRLNPVGAIMAEWVTGKYVRAWDNQFRALKLPPVDVRRVPSTE